MPKCTFTKKKKKKGIHLCAGYD